MRMLSGPYSWKKISQHKRDINREDYNGLYSNEYLIIKFEEFKTEKY